MFACSRHNLINSAIRKIIQFDVDLLSHNVSIFYTPELHINDFIIVCIWPQF